MNGKILAILAFMLLLSGLASAGDIIINSVSYEPAPAQPGSTVTVWVQVKNDSIYKAEDVLLKIEAKFPFSLQPGETAQRNIGEMEAHETIAVEYKVIVDLKAVHGEHSIKLLVGEEFFSKEEFPLISVLSRTPKLEIVESSVNELSPGTVQQVALNIKNVGGSIAKDIVLKVNPERTVTTTGVVVEREIVSLGAISNYIGYLEQGDEAEIEMTLAVNQDAALKNYSVPITMEYFDQNGTAKTETGYLGIKVSAEAEVDAVINNVEPTAFPGGTSEITVDLFNIGLADAKYVVVELSGSGVSVEESRQFIGTLEADDFDSFKTRVSFEPTVQFGSLPLILKIIYKDEGLQETVITKVLSLEVGTPTEAQGGLNIFAGLLGLIMLALQLVGLYVVAKWAWPRAWPMAKRLRERMRKK